ncbi:DNA-binding MarR family transcriptional regulator [Virgibacillus natechei]|uniref:DNA-binding MarR family transcriptional regulator n=1 Tax=Virgibacillus natechei TaxID=1216297 RepID=A0ABS4IJJ5_9BACI|nr:MarR family transcriptional regulator [Virgibacillus natechei]MBP1971118.1 DNA-binding MarR family transcriptional regulator [Virgibacillus natechei]UZD12196.1 MarR family transcriptional regulator [Virgibacillus natechei]
MSEINNRDLIHTLNQRFRFIGKELNSRLRDHGLYASQWSIIFCIDQFGPMTQTEIWKYLNIEAPTVTRTLSRMEESGWIVRIQGKDKRERLIELTEEASRNIKPIQQSVDEFDQEILAGLSAEEKIQLHQLLQKIKRSGDHAQ